MARGRHGHGSTEEARDEWPWKGGAVLRHGCTEGRRSSVRMEGRRSRSVRHSRSGGYVARHAHARRKARAGAQHGGHARPQQVSRQQR